MDIKKLVLLLVRIGSLVTAASVIWGLYYYGAFSPKGNPGDAFGCLYSSSILCKNLNFFAHGFPGQQGLIPYSSIPLLIGLVMLIVGIILKLSLKK